MHRNQFVTALTSIITVFALTSCSGVEPDYQNSGDKTVDSESVIEKQSLDEIWQTWDDVLQESYDNVRLDTGIQLEKPEEIGPMIFVQREISQEEQDRVFAEFVPDMKKKYYSYPDNVSPPGPEYQNPGTGEHLGVGTNGFVYYMKNDKVSSVEQGQLEETIYFDRKYEDKSFQLRDGEITLEKAAELAEEMEKRWEKTVENVYSNRLRKVEIYSSEENTDFKNLVFYFEKCYKGVNVLTTRRMVESGEEKPLNVDYIPYYDDKVIVSSVKGAEYLNSNAGIVKMQTEVKSEKIVSLRSALQLFSKEMAGYHINEVKSIELSYRFCNKEGESCRFLAGTEYTASPCWVFWMNEESYAEEFALVDCETGKVDYIKNY